MSILILVNHHCPVAWFILETAESDKDAQNPTTCLLDKDKNLLTLTQRKAIWHLLDSQVDVQELYDCRAAGGGCCWKPSRIESIEE